VTDPEALRVLIVDDDVESATIFALQLQLHGCHTATAFGAETGLQVLEVLKPDLAFIDLGMPGADGCYTLKVFKEGVPDARPLYVCLTGHADFASQALAAGFDRFVAKPMEPEALTKLLEEARARRASKGTQEAA
jgi:CheY-like chemotaxis protein